jgi:transposase-like protein
MAGTKKDALVAFDAFVEIYDIKYEKAVECPTKDRDALLAFYDFPAEHWKHLRTSNPVESTFATVRHRTVRSKGCLSNETALQACSGCRETLASPRWTKAIAKGHSRGMFHRRNRGCKRRSPNCRLTSLVTNIRS